LHKSSSFFNNKKLRGGIYGIDKYFAVYGVNLNFKIEEKRTRAYAVKTRSLQLSVSAEEIEEDSGGRIIRILKNAFRVYVYATGLVQDIVYL